MGSMKRLENAIDADMELEPMSASARYLFAPLDKRALGVAIGLVAGLVVAGVTVLDLALGDPWPSLDLMREFFAGYSLSPLGAVVGAAWAFAVGFCAGWLLAFIRNLVLAVSLFLLRSRADLDSASDFLDHI